MPLNGIFYALAAYTVWGLFPLYFKLLHFAAPLEILAHRMTWSLVFIVAVLSLRKQWKWLPQVLAQPTVLLGFLASALLLACNWFTYIFAINSNRVVDASLGYFITPLVSVMLGLLILKERLRRLQWVSIVFAAAGVAWLTWQAGHPPWISLILAASFGTYGLLRKTAALGALEGLSLETLILFPFALSYLLYLGHIHQSAFTASPLSLQLLLTTTGPVTAIPLLMFAAGARRLSMSTIGLLQYMSPTLQLFLGIWLYREPFDQFKFVGYILIWIGLAIYSVEGFWTSRAAKMAAQTLTSKTAADIPQTQCGGPL